jgi:hypothetical protein
MLTCVNSLLCGKKWVNMCHAPYIVYHILYNIHHILYTSPKIQIYIFDLVEFEPKTLGKHPNTFAKNPH